MNEQPNLSHFRIDSNIPAPTGHYREKYPFKDMKPGDSVFFPGSTSVRINTALGRRKALLAERWTVRTVTENGVKGARAWRLE